MSHELMADFQVDACSLGALTSIYLYAYSGLQLPVGALLDSFGPKRLLIFATLLCTLGTVLFGSADFLPMALVGRFLIGAGSAFGFLSCMKLGALWFPPQKLSIVVGLTLFVGTLGAMSGSYPMSFLVDGLGWRNAIWISAAGGIFLCVLIFYVVKNQPPSHLKKYIEQHHPGGNPSLPLFKGFQVILKKPQTWLLAFYGTMMFIPLSGFADIWGVPFLSHVHHMDKQSASLATSLLYLGVGIGTPLFALISDSLKQFRVSLIGSAIGSLIPFIIVVYCTGLPAWLVISLLFTGGIMLGGQFMEFAVVSEINPISVSGMATGFQNMINLSSGIFVQPLIGWILDSLWDATLHEGVRIYSAETYKLALSTVIVALALAVLSSFWIKEAYPER